MHRNGCDAVDTDGTGGDDSNSCVDTAATQAPYDGIDQACDGADLTGVDGDGYDAVDAVETARNNENKRVNTAATNTCHSVDNRCNGDTDESGAADASTFYADGDSDGYGDPASPPTPATHPLGMFTTARTVTTATGMPTQAPLRPPTTPPTKTAHDTVDQDVYGDRDYGAGADGFESVDAGGPDCNDSGPDINPTATEIWNDGIDQNGDGPDNTAGFGSPSNPDDGNDEDVGRSGISGNEDATHKIGCRTLDQTTTAPLALILIGRATTRRRDQ